jgi:hypothetical protein
MLRVKIAPLKRHAGTAVCGSGLATPSTGRTIYEKALAPTVREARMAPGRLEIKCCPLRGTQTWTTYSNIPTNEKVHVPHFCTAVQNYGPAYNTELATLVMWPTMTEDTTLIHTLISVRFFKTQIKRGQEWTGN